MKTIKIADIRIRLNNRYDDVELLCHDYIVDDEPFDFSVEVTEADISEEMKLADGDVSCGYAETVCLHRKIAEQLWRYDAFLLHAALISCDGEGYAFAARSGVGKSTHIGLWRKVFGDRVRVINGDKPIIRFTEEGILAYGTPWNGKEGFGENDRCPLRALGFLDRATDNKIEAIAVEEATMRLFPQVFLPTDPSAMEKTLDLVDRFVNGVSFHHLYCNMEEEAAQISYSGMTQNV